MSLDLGFDLFTLFDAAFMVVTIMGSVFFVTNGFSFSSGIKQ